jgi:hypothetical protein
VALGKCNLSVWIAVVLLLSAGSLNRAVAQTAPPVGTTQQFAVLGGSAVTNTGPTVLKGDLGVSPGTAITGFRRASSAERYTLPTRSRPRLKWMPSRRTIS